MIIVILVYYALVAAVIFTAWLNVFLHDATTPNTHLLSWVVLVFGSGLWIVIIPLAYGELRRLPATIKREY